MLEGLVPVSDTHSIKRVIATIFIPQAFLKPEDVFKKVKDSACFEKYQKKTLLKPTTISIKDNSVLGVSSNAIAGFIFEEFDDRGRPKNILKLENIRDNQAVITIENRVYNNWTEFRDKIIFDVQGLSEKVDFYIAALSLTYVDEFKWGKNEKIPVTAIFNNDSELLNNKFFKSKNGTQILISQSETKEGYNVEEKTELTFNNDVKRVALSHQYAIKLASFHLYDTLAEQGKFEKYFDYAHKENKLLLKEILTGETQTLINLK